MRTNLENPRINGPRVSGISFANVIMTISATFVIPDEGPTVYLIDGGGADRTVRLPLLQYERQVVIANLGATNNLAITNSSGTAQLTLAPQSIAVFYAGTTRWIWLTNTFVSSILADTVLTGTAAIAATDVSVQVNSAGVAVLTLPLSAAWTAASGWRGLPLSIFDISGNASTNNITINPSGGQTISGLASLTIAGNYDGFRLRPKSGGGWVVV